MLGPAATNGHGLRRGAPPRTVIGVLADEATRAALTQAAQQRGIPCAFELGTIETALAELHPDEIADCVIVDLDGTPDAVDDVAVLAIGLPADAELILLGIFTEQQTAELAQAGARLCLPKPLSAAAINRILGPVPTTMAQAPEPPRPAYQPPTVEPAPQAAPQILYPPPQPLPPEFPPPQMPAPVYVEPQPMARPPHQSGGFEPREAWQPAAVGDNPFAEIAAPEIPAAPQPAPRRQSVMDQHRPPEDERQPPPIELAAQASRLAPRYAEPPPSYGAPPPRTNLAPGRVLSVVGCRGGVGASTIAVGLAWLMAEEFGRNTALLDLDPYFGSVALALNLEPGDALQQALERPSRIDKVFLDRALRKVGQNLFVLCSEQSLDKPAALDPAGPATLVRSLSARHERVVVDLPRSDPDVMLNVLALSDEIILVSDLSLAGARDAMRLMALVRKGTAYARMRIVGGGARDAGKSPILSPSEFRRAVGAPIDIAIAHDGETAMDAARSGRPLPKVFPRSTASKSLRNLAQSLEAHEQREPKRRLLFWKK